MKTLKMAFAIIALSCISSLSFAKIILENNTNYWLSVKIPYWVFIGMKEELNFDVAPNTTHEETKDLAYVKEDVYVKAYYNAPSNRTEGTGPVAEVSFGKNFGGSLAQINVFTSIDSSGLEVLKLTLDAK